MVNLANQQACPGCTKSYDNIHCHKSGIRISTCKPFLRKDPESVNIFSNQKLMKLKMKNSENYETIIYNMREKL